MSECLNPRIGVQVEDGKKPIIIRGIDYEFWAKLNDQILHHKLLLIPCGNCPNCLQNKSLEWTSRLVKEAEEWKYTYFLTFTYDNKALRFNDSEGVIRLRDVLDEDCHPLLKRDMQLFLKRFRDNTDIEMKYFLCCEAGETTSRTHWHAIFFMNQPLKDLVFYANNLYTSETLSKCWKKGQVLASADVNERNIKYTIGYTLKKLGESKLTMMSKGLGLKFLNDKKEDIKFSKGFYLNNGFLVNPPSYFIRKLKESSLPEDIEWLKEYENQPRSSIKITKSIKDLIQEMLTHKDTLKGKGVF